MLSNLYNCKYFEYVKKKTEDTDIPISYTNGETIKQQIQHHPDSDTIELVNENGHRIGLREANHPDVLAVRSGKHPGVFIKG